MGEEKGEHCLLNYCLLDDQQRSHWNFLYNAIWHPEWETGRKPKLDSKEELSSPDELKKEAVQLVKR